MTRLFVNEGGEVLRPLYIQLLVTDAERALIKRAAAQAHGWSVSTWATVNLVQLAEIETAGSS